MADKNSKNSKTELTDHQKEIIVKNMIPFVLSRGYIFGNKEQATINSSFMWNSSEWDVIMGKNIVKSEFTYTKTTTPIDKYSSRFVVTPHLSKPGIYKIDNKLYTEIRIITSHPDGMFTFKPFLDEVYQQMPESIKNLIEDTKIYISTQMYDGDTSTDHRGATLILIPE